MIRTLIADQCTRAAYAALTPDAADRVRRDAIQQCDGEIMVGTIVGGEDLMLDGTVHACFQVWDGKRLVVMLHVGEGRMHYEAGRVHVAVPWTDLPDTVVAACTGKDVSRLVDVTFAKGRIIELLEETGAVDRWSITVEARDAPVSLGDDENRRER